MYVCAYIHNDINLIVVAVGIVVSVRVNRSHELPFNDKQIIGYDKFNYISHNHNMITVIIRVGLLMLCMNTSTTIALSDW